MPLSKEEKAFFETYKVMEQTYKALGQISAAKGAPDLSEVKQAQIALNFTFQNRHIINAIKKAKKLLTKLSSDLKKKQQKATEEDQRLAGRLRRTRLGC